MWQNIFDLYQKMTDFLRQNKDHTCPITVEKIRDPVTIQGQSQKHVFEREALIQWLKVKHTNPMTNKLMTRPIILIDNNSGSEEMLQEEPLAQQTEPTLLEEERHRLQQLFVLSGEIHIQLHMQRLMSEARLQEPNLAPDFTQPNFS